MDFYCSFAEGKWNAGDWQFCRSPRWEACSSWRQESDCIANEFAADLDPSETQMGRERTGETYLSMLWRQPLYGSCRVETTCSFEERMAPLIVFSKELVSVHREHLEVVLYDKGINLWHHFFNDGKPSWKLIAFGDYDLPPDTRHHLVAEIRATSRGKFLYMGIDKPDFGCRIPDDWDEYFTGFTACEGHNRFYDFAVKEVKPLEIMKERISD